MAMADTHIHIHLDGSTGNDGGGVAPTKRRTRKASAPKKKAIRRPGAGLPKKYAKMGFKKGWKAYKKTPAYKRKKKARR